MGKYMIKSKFRFTLFLTIMIIICVSGMNLLLGTTTEVSGATIDQYATVEVVDGDTLWSIADVYNNGMDNREFVYEICELNDIENYVIVPGQELKIPIC